MGSWLNECAMSVSNRAAGVNVGNFEKKSIKTDAYVFARFCDA